MRTVINIRNLGKKYRISHQANSSVAYKSLREDLSNGLKQIGKKILGRNKKISKEDFWALKDINLEIELGDRVGIIGRNGAGKSTLLKILSRITEPTTGIIKIKGKLASLLEVGTGFHPELTGRENIFLNASIMGMSRLDIKKRFDSIVEFAEIQQFIDTPVKRFSSGMYVRLAFAVAAHLEPDILVVDEVLAVGDIEFQKKSLKKLENISINEGKTVLFVSHNMGAIEKICNRGVLIHKGEVYEESREVTELIKNYFKLGGGTIGDHIWKKCGNRYRNPYFDPLRLALIDKNGIENPGPFRNDEDIFLLIEAQIAELDSALEIGIRVFSERGILILCSQQTDKNEENWPKIVRGFNRFKVLIPRRFLNEGTYIIILVCSLYRRIWIIDPSKSDIQITMEINGGLSDSPYWLSKRGGLMAPVLDWDNC